MSAGIFELEIVQDGTNGYRVRVLTSPAGEASAPFVPPFGPEELAALPFGGLTAEEIGLRLFESAFTGKVRSRFDESRGKAGEGLRLLLRFDLDHKETAWISSFPWELLYHPELREFIALDPALPVVRWFEVPVGVRPVPLQPPLRILFVAASPADRMPVSFEEEWHRLVDEVGRNKAIETRCLKQTTFDEFRKVLRREGPFQIVHFVGHGEFDSDTGLGCLVFETCQGEADPVSADILGDLFRERGREPSLFVLNACETARIEPTMGLDPFAGVAAKLVRRGAPAVVAMQLAILDKAAIAFSESFYSSLARAEPVDVAVTHGRRAIRCVCRDSTEWATPVLFLRTRDGRLFEAPQPSETSPAPVKAPVAQSPERAGATFQIGSITSQESYVGQTLNISHHK